ncbi:MAG: hypothetical protein IJP80_07430 [Bacteroidales bacterium]|nr:hypothetical protein [Bacteroidales bacterium]
MNLKRLLIPFVAALLLWSCDRYEGGVTAPSYLRINSVTVEDDPGDSWSYEDGFFTSNVDAVNIVIYVQGDTAETNLGTFQLPCEIPVLRNGKIDRVTVYPVVKQDGIAGKRINYPFYNPVKLTDVVLNTDQVTDLGNLRTRFIPKSQMVVKWEEFFEPGPSEFSVDSVVVACNSTDTVCSGYGCGAIHVRPGQASVSFGTDTTIYLPTPSSIVYVEMEYWSDLDFSIGLNNPTVSGGSNNIKSHMTIYGKPQQGWQKIYINLGALWSKEYNSYERIRPYFTILNGNGRGGNVYIDNIKLIVL